jgi:methionyl-tRNA formyltransferase
MKTAFFGTSEFAVTVLDALEDAGYVPDIVVTAPDKPKGRKLKLTPPPVKLWAQERRVRFYQPEELDDGFLQTLTENEVAMGIVASYGKILPKAVLNHFRDGILNVHPSLLPKLRGASPVRTAVLDDARDAVGVTIMLMDEQMDHGPIVAQASVDLEEWPVEADMLETLLAQEGGSLLAEVIPEWTAGSITPEPQDDSQATYTRKITKEDGQLICDEHGWPITAGESGRDNYYKILALQGWPGAYFFATRQKKKKAVEIRVKVTAATYKNNALAIERVVPEGKDEMTYTDFVNGYLT